MLALSRFRYCRLPEPESRLCFVGGLEFEKQLAVGSHPSSSRSSSRIRSASSMQAIMVAAGIRLAVLEGTAAGRCWPKVAMSSKAVEGIEFWRSFMAVVKSRGKIMEQGLLCQLDLSSAARLCECEFVVSCKWCLLQAFATVPPRLGPKASTTWRHSNRGYNTVIWLANWILPTSYKNAPIYMPKGSFSLFPLRFVQVILYKIKIRKFSPSNSVKNDELTCGIEGCQKGNSLTSFDLHLIKQDPPFSFYYDTSSTLSLFFPGLFPTLLEFHVKEWTDGSFINPDGKNATRESFELQIQRSSFSPKWWYDARSEKGTGCTITVCIYQASGFGSLSQFLNLIRYFTDTRMFSVIPSTTPFYERDINRRDAQQETSCSLMPR